MPNYVSLTESQRRKIAVFITESQQQAQLQQQQQLQGNSNGDDSVNTSLTGSPGGSSTSGATASGNNSISCKEIVQFCRTRFGLTISLSTASRLRSTAQERLSTELLNPSAKRHRSVKFPEFEKALVQELKALEQEQLQIQQEQERQSGVLGPFVDPNQLPPVMMLTSEAAITQVAKGIAERMGIPPMELGLTSGWYHGFKRRHGIKHRQFKSRSAVNGRNGSPPAIGTSGPTPGSAGATGAGDGSTGSVETGEGSDGGDGDEEMEDAQETTGAGDSKIPESNSTTLLNISNIVLTPKEPPASSLSGRPEVKKVTAAAANDALDVISEYLLQNGQIGATKLPLVKELRKFLLAQTELENGAANNSAILLGVPVLTPATSGAESTTGFSSTITTVVNTDSSSGPEISAFAENRPAPLDPPASNYTNMEDVVSTQEQEQQEQGPEQIQQSAKHEILQSDRRQPQQDSHKELEQKAPTPPSH